MLDLVDSVVADALAAGAGEAEVTAVIVERFHAQARDRQITKLEQSTGRSLTLRAFVERRKATLSTSDLTAGGLHDLVRATVDAARFVTTDPNAGLPERVEPFDDAGLEIYAEDVRARNAEAKLDDARALEAIARAYDPRISNSNGSNVVDSSGSIAFANSRGFRGAYRTSSVARDAHVIAQDGSLKRAGGYGTAARSYADLEGLNVVATSAARRAIEQCGARKPSTLRCPVIFERDVAAHVLGDLFSAANAANLAAGNSFLADKAGRRVGSELVTIVDDGRLPKGLATAPFDAEGVPTRRTVVFARGVFETFLYDTYYGRKLGAASTGSAVGGGIGPRNFHLIPGTQSLAELVAATSRGVLVMDTIGFSTESVTGTYSRGARGFAIENGELAYPIDEFTIAGNLLDMLAAINAVANDLKFDGAIAAPSFRVAEMTVSGN